MDLAELKNTTKVECLICGYRAHFLELHLMQAHEMTVEKYIESYPTGKVLSDPAIAKLKELEQQSRNEKVDISIADAFGCEINKIITSVKGFKHSHPSTPVLDEDYSFRVKALSVVLNAAVDPTEKVLLTGPTGSGKTSIIEQAAARLNMPFYRVNFDGDMGRADLIGQWILKGEDMDFLYGLLPRAMKEGAWMCVDEWDCANPSVAMALQAVLEGKPLTITETNEIVKPHPDFRIFATSNTLGMGDESGLYNGTQPQNFASLDRFTMVEYVDYPSRENEAKILAKKTGLTDKKIKERFALEHISAEDNANAIIVKLLKVAKLVREAFVKEEISSTMSTRTIVNIAKKLLTFGDVKRSYELAYLNKLGSEDRVFVSEIIQRVWAV